MRTDWMFAAPSIRVCQTTVLRRNIVATGQRDSRGISADERFFRQSANSKPISAATSARAGADQNGGLMTLAQVPRISVMLRPSWVLIV